jgi:putative hydrolase of the HAD superfamily
MSAVEAVLLDVGGVFVVPSPEILRPLLGVEAPDEVFVRAHYTAVAALDAFGLEGWPAYYSAYASAVGVPPERMRRVLPTMRAKFHGGAIDVWCHVRPDSVDGLRQLDEAGVPVAIVSNSDGTVEQVLRDYGICQVGEGDGTCVATVVDSRVVGVEKPDPAIFTHALDVLDVDPTRCLYLGDTVCADVMGARAAGLHPVHLDPYGFCLETDHDHVSSVAGLLDLL